MKLLPNSKDVLLKAWSVRLMIISGVLSGLQTALPFINKGFSIDPAHFAIAVFVINVLAFIARFCVQEALK